MIGRIRRLGLREVWPHEARDFTTWLEENVDVLSEATDLNLSNVEREEAVGTFNVDLTAEDDSGRIVIENQLGKSDHDHLGKLLTYLVGVEARKAIWIVADPRPEHVGTIAWLNESSSADFYLVKLEAIRIGSSEPAPLLTLIVGPSEATRDVGRTKQRMNERDRLRYRFFEGLLEFAKSKTRLHSNVSPGRHNWVGTGAGIAGLGFNYVVRQHDARAQLYIDTVDGDENQRIFKNLSRHRDKIEKAFGGPLEWDTKEGRRSCRIEKTYDLGGYRDEDDWKAVYEQLAEGMARLESALKLHIKSLRG